MHGLAARLAASDFGRGLLPLRGVMIACSQRHAALEANRVTVAAKPSIRVAPFPPPNPITTGHTECMGWRRASQPPASEEAGHHCMA